VVIVTLCSLQGLKDLKTLCWAWRADADVAWEDGDRFYPGAHCACVFCLMFLIDPVAWEEDYKGILIVDALINVHVQTH
jgi:hypothetical protein